MKHIAIHIEGAVGTITIDRPQRFNSLDVETARDLRKAGLQLARDEAVRAVVLRGSNGVFCSGADLKYIRAGGERNDLDYLRPEASSPSSGPSRHPLPATRGEGRRLEGSSLESRTGSNDLSPEGRSQSSDSSRRPSPRLRGEGARRADEGHTAQVKADEGQTAQGEADEGRIAYGDVFKQILEYIHSTISEIRRAPKPFIAAVDGIAAAGGFGLAMSCDLVLASDRATFEWAYSKTGLTGAESSTFMLPKLIGLRRAFELLFLNPRLDAKRALEIGLITAVVPSAAFEDDVKRIAQQLASGPTEAFGIAKELLNEAAGMDRLDFHLDRELDYLARIADGSNFAEGIDAFFEKRPALFGAK